MESKSNLEVKVGLFIFIGLIILTVIVFSVKEFYFLKPRYNVRVVFDFVNGIQVGAPVRLAGVKVGEVEKMNLFYNEELEKTQVEIFVYLKKDVKIPQDSRVEINTLGLLGERYLEITPGKDYARLFKEGDTLMGTDPVSITEVTKMGYQIGLKLDETINSLNIILGKIKTGKGTLGRLLSEDKLYEDLEYLLKDIKEHPWKLLRKTEKRIPSKSRRKR